MSKLSDNLTKNVDIAQRALGKLLSITLLFQRAQAISQTEAEVRLVKKQVLRILRKVSRRVSAEVSLLEKLLQQLNELYKYIKDDFADAFRQDDGFETQIKVYTAKLIEGSGPRSTLYKKIKRSFDSKEIFNTLNAHNQEVLLPLDALLKEIITYIHRNEIAIKKASEKVPAVKLEIVSKGEVILLDTSYLRELEKAQNGKEYNIECVGDCFLVEEVLDELNKLSTIFKRRLVPLKFIKYLKTRTQIIKVEADEHIAQRIKTIWQATPKGRNASVREIELFDKTADFKIIAYVLLHPEKRVLILTEDNDIIGMVTYLKREGYNVRFETFEKLQQAA